MNRFRDMDQYLKRRTNAPCPPGKQAKTPRRQTSAPMSAYAQPFAAADRALVVLIENGGVDLGIPALVDKILANIPGASRLIPDSYRAKLVETLRDALKTATDRLIETAELTVNRYSSAAPGQFGEVAILRDGTSSYDDLKGKLTTLSKAGKIIDLFILTHGGNDSISVPGGVDGNKIREMKTQFGKPLSIRSVYMMNCVGSSLNQAWLDAGAKVSSGAMKNNYLPEPSMYLFWQAWKGGQSFENAVTSAYRRTIKLMNDTVRNFISALPVPGTSALAGQVDFEKFDFVTDSAPVIQGQRTVTINSDSLTFTQSLSDPMATTVLPISRLQSMSGSYAMAVSMGSSPSVAHSYSFHSPSVVMQVSEYSIQQNPAALVIAGIEVADAAQIGLAAAAMVQAQVAASQGSFTLTFDKAQRLLTPEARAQMPGSQTAKKSYSRRLFWISIARVNTAEADVMINWEGNAYGEIGTPIIERNLSTSTEWSKSSANITITRTERIPLPRTDPRTWPIVYTYIGTYDPLGNGYFEFSGEFELNAFGGLKFNRHQVVSRSFADFALGGTPEGKVRKGDDVIVPVPAIPQEQIDYLKTKLG
jgi:hypothetical protein